MRGEDAGISQEERTPHDGLRTGRRNAEFIQDAVKFYLRFKGERHGTFYFAEKSSEKQSEEPRLHPGAHERILAAMVR